MVDKTTVTTFFFVEVTSSFWMTKKIVWETAKSTGTNILVSSSRITTNHKNKSYAHTYAEHFE